MRCTSTQFSRTYRGPNFVLEPEHLVRGSTARRMKGPGQVHLPRLPHPHDGEPVLDGQAGGGDWVAGEAGLPIKALQGGVEAYQVSEQKKSFDWPFICSSARA